MKVHYNNALAPEKRIVFACGLTGTLKPATTDPDLMTCRNCRKRMGTPKRPDPYPDPAVIFMFGDTVMPWRSRNV